MTKYCAIFGVCSLLAYIILAVIELSLNVVLWPGDVTLGLIVTATAFISVGMHNDK